MTLRNVARPPRPLTLHLSHRDVCASTGTCTCQRIRRGVQLPTENGQRRLVVQEMTVPQVLTLLVRGSEGDRLEGLPLAVLHAPEVKALLGRGLEATVVEAKAESATAPVSPAADAHEVEVELDPDEAAHATKAASKEHG